MSTNSLSFSALYLVFFGLFQIAEANIDGRIKIRAEIEEVRRSVNVISEKLKQLKESDHAKIDLGSSKVFSGNLKPSKKNKSDDISNVALYSEMRAEIQEVRRSLTGISEKLNKLKESDHAKIVSGSSTAFSGNLKPSKKNKLDVVSNVPLQTNVEHRVNEDSKIHSSGFYILPFSGLLTSQNLAWESPFFGKFEIEEEMGISSGLSTGYEGRNFFADVQLSYFQNKMKSLSLPSWLKSLFIADPSFSGESKGLGINMTGGGRIHFNEFISYSLGAGIGGVDQDLSFLFNDTPFEEEDFVMSYQIFSGFEFRPTKSTSIGLRYRWLHIDEMDVFTSRDLHMLEMWLKYLF